MRPKILRNAARCNACQDVIESRHRHDFRVCKCGATMVDGGLSYIRRGCGPSGLTDLCEYEVTPSSGKGGGT